MFYTRYEAEDAGGASVSDLAARRLALLKERIAAKQQAAQNGNGGTGIAETTTGDVGETGRSHGVSNGVSSASPEKKRKRKKREAPVAEQEPSVGKRCKEEESLIGEEVRKKKRKKKKMDQDQENIPESVAITDTLNEDNLKLSAVTEEISPAEKKTKKKKKKKIEAEKENTLEDVQHSITQPDPIVDDTKGQEVEPAKIEEKVEEDEKEEKVEEEEKEEWTVLGRKSRKTVQTAVKRELPDWIAEGHVIDPGFDHNVPLTEFGLLGTEVRGVLETMEIQTLFPVQSEVIPEILRGATSLARPQDLCVCGPTGSGKTLVYAISLAQVLQKTPPLLQAIVVVPTKNLAQQVKQVFTSFSSLIRVALVSGKSSLVAEERALYTETGTCQVHVVVATPGRLVHHLRESPHLSLSHLRYLVIDEVDSLLGQAYQDWLTALLDRVSNPPPSTGNGFQPLTHTRRYTPATPSLARLRLSALPLQKLLFSATITHNPAKLAPLQLYRPVLFSCGSKYTLPSTLQQHVIRCRIEDKALVLIHLVRSLRHLLCFTGSVDTAHRLALLAEEFPDIAVSEFSSTLSLPQRNRVVRDFATNKTNLLVCSDSLARGMDIAGVVHVVNYDVPAHVQTYVHRVGRTARAGREGHAYTLTRYEEMHHFRKMLRKAGGGEVKELPVPEEAISELSETYQTFLDKLETKLKQSK